ncbi:hypothetical protein AB0K05_42480 [Nonomuraea sp. NPDC049486]|uniref:hypothetical protein n=1 Tax=Nonomuraea sp. NPDC049486 TaxID=3155773 RepID=UPI003421F2C0
MRVLTMNLRARHGGGGLRRHARVGEEYVLVRCGPHGPQLRLEACFREFDRPVGERSLRGGGRLREDAVDP